ncbi:hypothetical protein PE067_21205 [Paracoccus sp. DMF-8]|uniref:hypothetical protein n=1 Tax=Paracoccus sp. DMF-8 TaxID=3019445 RepID=UPI0023E3ACEE|nr:hypothetical protein [Paracoccus sp. DMF-8]MDF3608441.1 hypothetical protein [Paracoccus sp. DMF-8]
MKQITSAAASNGQRAAPNVMLRLRTPLPPMAAKLLRPASRWLPAQRKTAETAISSSARI